MRSNKTLAAIWAALIIAVLVSACNGPLTAVTGLSLSSNEQGIRLPETDKRRFRYLELDNGLKVLLISDPGADKAAASLDVLTGSGDDPRDYQGLAHFLEHMLFLGTEKYPEAGDYQQFISANGGGHNAFTSFEHTNYFFDIRADALEPALDRFAQFFVAPLFNAEYVNREVNAVDSEYRARIRDDRRRELAVFKSQLNPEHPFATFSVGNLETLQSDKEEALREQLLAFYQRHYSANRMSLTVIGGHSLNALEKMVESRFGEVVNRELSREPIAQPLFDESRLPRWITIQPVQNERSLSVQFPVPESRSLWRSKPLNYIGNLLGHEGPGSLLSVLKERGWAESLAAGQSLNFDGQSLFGVEITLTSLGMARADQIVDLLFEELALIRDNGIAEWRYREQSQLARQQFLYRTRSAPINEVVQLSSNLHRYPFQEVIRGDYQMSQFDGEQIARFLAQMTPDRAYISLMAPEVETQHNIPRYQVNYGERALDSGTVGQWQQTGSDHKLAMPDSNEFIAEDFSLSSGGRAIPRAVETDTGVSLWWRDDNHFDIPKGSAYALLTSPAVAESAESLALSKLWVSMVEDQLNERTYAARLAGLSYNLSTSWRGLVLTVSGFDDKQTLLAREVLQALIEPEWRATRFERLRARYLRALQNTREKAPYKQVMAELPRVLRSDQMDLDAMIAATQAATLPAIKAHAKRVLTAMNYQLLVDGNYSRDQAEDFAAVLAEVMPKPAQQVTAQQQIRALEPGVDLRREVASSHQDAAIASYVQAPGLGKRDRVALGVVAQMMSADFYYQLRTQKQLGYVVNAGVYPQRDIGGLIFLVQSPVMDAAGLQREVNDYLQRWLKDGVSEADYQQHKATLLAKLRESPKNLSEASERHWQDLLDGYTDFDSREQLIAALHDLSYQDWWQRVQATLAPSQRRMLTVYHPGQWADAVPAGQDLEATAPPADASYRFK